MAIHKAQNSEKALSASKTGVRVLGSWTQGVPVLLVLSTEVCHDHFYPIMSTEGLLCIQL
jgi:hypothetical protein